MLLNFFKCLGRILGWKQDVNRSKQHQTGVLLTSAKHDSPTTSDHQLTIQSQIQSSEYIDLTSTISRPGFASSNNATPFSPTRSLPGSWPSDGEEVEQTNSGSGGVIASRSGIGRNTISTMANLLGQDPHRQAVPQIRSDVGNPDEPRQIRDQIQDPQIRRAGIQATRPVQSEDLIRFPIGLPYKPGEPFNILNRSQAVPGAFKWPVILRTARHGSPRHRDIRIEEVLQSAHLTSATVCSSEWDMHYWESQTDKRTSQTLIMESKDIPSERAIEENGYRIVSVPPDQKLHCNFMLLFFVKQQQLRVVMTSASMTPQHWGENGKMENMVMIIDLPQETGSADLPLSQFGHDLGQYCRALGTPNEISKILQNYDWEESSDLIFVSMGPGLEQFDQPADGLTALHKKLSQSGLIHDGEIQIDYVTSPEVWYNRWFMEMLRQACTAPGTMEGDTDTTVTNRNAWSLDRNRTIRIHVDAASSATSNESVKLNLTAYKGVFKTCKSIRHGCSTQSNIIFVQPRGMSDSYTPMHNEWQVIRSLHSINYTVPQFHREIPIPWVYMGSAKPDLASWERSGYGEAPAPGFRASNWECGVVMPVRTFHSNHTREGDFLDLTVFDSIMPVPVILEDTDVAGGGSIPVANG